MTRTIRALDVGSKRTKFTSSNGGTHRSFPSIAAPLTDTLHPLRRGAVELRVDGRMYEVGAQSNTGAADTDLALLQDGIETPVYRALAYAALQKMQLDHVDLLITGLPPHRHAACREALTRLLKATHEVCNSPVTIADVMVLPQPIGGLIASLYQCGIDWTRQAQRRYLVIDAGCAGFDWICTRGLQTIPGRSGTVPIGMSVYLARIHQILNRVLRKPYPDDDRIEVGLRTNNLRIGDRQFDVELLCLQAENVPNQAIDTLCNHVDVRRDIDEIIVVGGGSQFFEPTLRYRFPNMQIDAPEAPMYANVRGFHLAGQVLSREERRLLVEE